MKTPEKQVENDIKAFVRDSGGWFVKIHADDVQGSDTLDLFGSVFGKPFYVEVKKVGGVVSPMQHFIIERAKRSGYIAASVETLEEFKGLFDGR